MATTTVRRLVAFLGLELDEKSFKKADGALTALKAGAVGLAAAFGAREIARGFVAIINLASDAQETTQQLAALFGEASADIIKDSDDMAKRLGRSSFDIQKRIGAIGAIAKPLLGSGEAAREVATKFSELTVDLASFFNATEPQALNALRAGLTGEIEPLKKFGVVMSVAALNAFALEKGLGKTVDQMSIAEKTQLRFEFIMRNTTDAQGDAIRTAKGWANISRAVLSVTKDLATRLGQFLFPQIEKSASIVRDLVVNIRDWFKANEALIRSKIEPFIKTLGDVFEALVGTAILVHRGWVLLIKGAFDLVRALSPLEDSLDTILIIGLALVGVFGLLPLLLIAFITLLVLVADDLKGFREGKDSLIGEFLESPINPDDHWLIQILQGVVKWFGKGFEAMNIFLEGFAEEVVTLGADQAVLNLFTTAIDFWKKELLGFIEWVKENITIGDVLRDTLASFIPGGGLLNAAFTAKDQLEFVQDQGGNGQRRAVGAAAAAGPSTATSLSQSLVVNQVVNASPGMDETALAEKAADKIRRLEEGRRRIAARQSALRNNRGRRR